MNLPAHYCVSIPDTGTQQPNTIEFTLGGGMCLGIFGVSAVQATTVREQLPPPPATAYVQTDGGLISNLRVGENMILPAVYHADSLPEKFEMAIVSILSEFGYDNSSAGVLLAKLPADLTIFERRLVGFVRAAILRPQVIVYDSLWADLSEEEFERATGFDTIFRKHCPESVSIYLHSGNSLPFDVPFNQVIVL